MPSKKKAAKDVPPPGAQGREASSITGASPGPKPKAKAGEAASPPAKAPPRPVPAALPPPPAAEPVVTKPAGAKVPAPKPAAAKSQTAKPAAVKSIAVKPAAKQPDAQPSAPAKALAAKPAPAKTPKASGAKASASAEAASAARKPAAGKESAASPAPAKAAPAAAPKAKAAAKPAAAKPTFVKPPPRRAVAALDDMDTPDDDDLDDDDGPRARPAVQLPEEEVVEVAAPLPSRRLTPRPVPPLPARKPGVITLAISPDADDAFMLYALTHGKIELEGRRYELVRGEVARLNEEAAKGTYDVSAFSFGAWGQIVDRYLMLATGASLGDGVGPVVVSKTLVRPHEVNGLTVGVPGLTTTAALVLRLWLHPARLQLVPLPFEGVVEAVKTGKVRAGVLIHEAQLTYRLDGLTKVVDLGRWWTDRTDGLPLPLGGMVVRRDIPPEERTKIALDIKRSIAYAMGHRDEALTHAAQFSKGLPRPLLERYIGNYVNELTLDLGERGKQAVQALFDASLRMGMTREPLELEMA